MVYGKVGANICNDEAGDENRKRRLAMDQGGVGLDKQMGALSFARAGVP